MTQGSSRPQRISSRHGSSRVAGRGFTIFELLLTLAIISIVTGIVYASMERTLPRINLRNKATEVSGFLQQARFSAIKAGLDVSVRAQDAGNGEQWLVAFRKNPNGVGETETIRLNIGNINRPLLPYLAGAEGGSGDAAKAVTFTDDKLVYSSTGNAQGIGAFRISIGQLGRRNTIEVAIKSLGGQPLLRKYIKAADRPGSASAVEFFEETHWRSNWKWVWY